MKKLVFIFLISVIIASLLFGCASSARPEVNAIAVEEPAGAPMLGFTQQSSEKASMSYDLAESDEMYEYESISAAAGSNSSVGVNDLFRTGTAVNSSEKIIYSAYAELETLEFDDTINAVYELSDSYNCYIESSNISGNNYSSKYYGQGGFRRAYFTIRVPREFYSNFSSDVKLLGNVVSFSEDAQNITSQFTDTQARLDMYKIEEERILSFLERAENVEEMMQIESRLSEIRYSIESLTRQLTDWQSRVDYSAISLNINEVKELTPEPVVTRTLGEEIEAAVSRSFKGLVSFLRGALIFLLASLPILAIPAAGLIIWLFIHIKRKKKRIQRMSGSMQNEQDAGKKEE